MSQEVGSLHATLGLQDTGFKRGLDQAKQALNEAARMTQDATRYMAEYERGMHRETAASQLAAAAKRQQAAMERELLGAKAQLTAILGQESAAAQAVAQKYSLLTAAQQRELIATREQITAQKALQEAQLATAVATEKAALAAEGAAAKQLLAAQRNVGKNLTTVGRGLSGISMPIAAFEGAAALAGNDVSQAEAAIRARTGAQGSQLAGLDQSLRNVAVTVPQSMKTVGEAIGDVAARTGLTGKALEDLTRTELNFSRITGDSVGPLIRSTTQLFEQWGIKTRDQIPVLDLLNRAHEKTGVSAQKLAADLSRFSPVFHNMGLGIVDATAVLASFEKANLPVARVMQGLTQEMSRLAKVGVTDAHRAFQIIIQDLEHGKNPMAVMAEATRLFGARVGGDMVQAIRSGRFSLQELEKTLTDGGDTIDKAAAQTKTFGVAFGEFRNQVEVALAPLGILLLKAAAQVFDAMKPMIDKLKEAIVWFSQLSTGAQDATIAIVAGVALLGPAVVKIGGFITTLMEMRKAWLELQLVMSATGGGATGGVLGGLKVMGLAAVATGALWIGAFAAMGAAVYAFQTNWHGVTDDAVSGTRIFGGAVEKLLGKLKDAALLSKPGGKSLGQMYQESLLEAARDERGLNKELGPDYFRQQGDKAKPKGAAESALDKAIRDYKAEMERLNKLTSAGGGGGESDADIRARMAKAGAVGVKLTPLQMEQKQYTEQLAQAHVRLREELAGEDNVTARLQAHFHLLHLTNKDDLVVTEQRIRAHEKATAVTKSYRDALGRLQQQIRDVTSGESDKGLPAGFAQWSKGQQASYRQTSDYATWLKDRSDASEALKQQEQQALKDIHKGNADWERELQAAARLRKYDPSKPQRGYPDLAAALPTIPNLEQMASKTFDRPLNQLTVTEQHELSRAQQHQAADVTTQQGADIFKAYAEKRIADAKKADDESVKSYNAAAALKQKADEAEVKRHEQMSQAAIKDFQNQTQAWSAEQRKIRDALNRTAQQTQSFFQGMFTDLAEHGFKGFFSRVLTSFQQLLRQMAAEYLASQLTNALFGKKDPTSGERAGGLLEKAASLAIGAFGGGGGGGGKGDQWSSIFGLAGGGAFTAGVPFWAGERGKELVFPHSAGTVMPHAQSMALIGPHERTVGGSPVTIHMTVVAQDVQSFRAPHNQQAMMGDLHRGIERARRRG